MWVAISTLILHTLFIIQSMFYRFDRDLWFGHHWASRWNVHAWNRWSTICLHRSAFGGSSGDGLWSPRRSSSGRDMREREDRFYWILQETRIDKRGHQRRVVSYRLISLYLIYAKNVVSLYMKQIFTLFTLSFERIQVTSEKCCLMEL